MSRRALTVKDENLTVGIRFTVAQLERIDALLPALRLDPMLTATVPTPTRSLALRLAMLEGLAILEQRYHGKGGGE
jgi:hypothetical protein